MQRKIGYSLIDSIGNEIQHWSVVPNPISLPDGTVVHGLEPGSSSSNGYKIVERWIDESPATPYDVPTDQAPVYDGTKVLVTQHYQTPDLQTLQQIYKEKLEAVRWGYEKMGVLYANNLYDSSALAQGKISNILHDVILSGNADSYSINFKTLGNEFVTLTGNDIINLSKKIRSYVQACYDKEAEYSATISVANTSQLLSLDFTHNWPDGTAQ